MREALKFVGGSVAVYLVVAACSSHVRSGDDDSSSNDAGATSQRPDAGRANGVGGLAQNGGNGNTGNTGMMGASGQQEGTGGAGDGSGGGAPRDGGMMDAMVDGAMNPVPDASAQEMGGSRLKARYYLGDDGSKQFAGWYDTQRKENCTFGSAADGTLRCLPAVSATAVGSYYSDAGCSKPLATIACGAAAPKYAYSYSYNTAGCLVGPSLAPVGSRFTSATIYIGSAGTCTATTTPASADWYEVGSSLDPSAFVRATETTE
jgi:hypothetical protein